MQSIREEDRHDLEEIEKLSPFTLNDLKGVRFARGNMLGGANPLESATPAPWDKKSPDLDANQNN